MANQRNLTKFTVQEALNKEHYTAYKAVYDDSINLTTAALASDQTFPSSPGGATSIFADVDENGNRIIYNKVSVESDGVLVIELGTGGTSTVEAALGDPIYVLATALPITFTGYDITDLKIKTAATDSTLGITAWR